MRSSTSRVGRVAPLIVLVAAAMTMTALPFLPELSGAMWHLRHGSRVSFAGVSLKVPFTWSAITGGNAIVVIRMARFGGGDLESTIVVGPLKAADSTEAGFERLRTLEVEMMANHGNRFVAERQVHGPKLDGACYKFQSGAGINGLLINCDFPESHVRFEFSGKRSWETEFYKILEGAK